MARFVDPESARNAFERIGRLTSQPVDDFMAHAFDANPNPDQALVHFERWLNALGNPSTQFANLRHGGLGPLLLMLMGASHQLADVLVQNPELADLVLDPDALAERPTAAQVVKEGRRLLQGARSYHHELDRLRFLKQGWYLRLAVNDLASSWPESDVWHSLSELADGLLELLVEVVWKHYAAERNIAAPCPVSIVGFGKLGGHELNYSSDIDLVYVIPDDTDETTERHAGRFCELLGQACQGRMSRGALFRVDLRLRPFGRSGPIVSRMRALESYYERYAEAWEHLALIRSRVVIGDRRLAERWDAMRERVSFAPLRGEWVIEELLAMRERVEELGGERDVKRGAGGIRDVEFLTQILQMLEGHAHPELRVRPTTDALAVARGLGLVRPADAEMLTEGYTLLRQVEHRIQLVGDLQTHEIPSDEKAKETLARGLGFHGAHEFEERLSDVRTEIRAIYTRTLRTGGLRSGDPRDAVAKALGKDSAAALAWIDALASPSEFYATLVGNEGSLRRLSRIARFAPKLVEGLRADYALTEQLLSGEIEEDQNPAERIRRLEPSANKQALATALRRAWTAATVRWVLLGEGRLGPDLAAVADAGLVHILNQVAPELDVLALGSYGSCDQSWASDEDALFLVGESVSFADAERSAQAVLQTLRDLAPLGSPLHVDLRLRPEGRSGALVRTDEGFEAYRANDMESWERFALGRARLVKGRERALELVRKAAYEPKLDAAMLDELLYMKHRIETERVAPQHIGRQIKLGRGGLDDIDWLVQLALMAEPSALTPDAIDAESRLRCLADSKQLNLAEVAELRHARRLHLATREMVLLLGYEPDIVPENPDKLERLAQALGYGTGNAFLAEHNGACDSVRTLYEETIRRLR